MKPTDELQRAIGRMLMVGVRGRRAGDAALEADLDDCAEARVKGVILFDVHLPAYDALRAAGAPDDQARRRAMRNIESPEQMRELITHIRARLGDDVIIAVDHEGGWATRLTPMRGFAPTPEARAFAAMDEPARRDAAAHLADLASSVGVDLNLAPCVDLDLSPGSLVISGKGRSYGREPDVVVQCAQMVIEAHRRRGVMTCLKHFPGHGAANVDSHELLPDVTRRAKTDELTVYRSLIPSIDETTWVMTGHLLDRRFDARRPASLSAAHSAARLRDELGFAGVIVTDSLDMGAVTERWTPEQSAVMAVNAGADVVLDGHNAPGPERPCRAAQLRDAILDAAASGAIEGGAARLLKSAARIERSRRAARA